jgi:uncharacterized Zn finger protein
MSRYNRYSDYDNGWPPYVTVAERKVQAAKMVASLKKKGQDVNPIVIEGRAIAKTFWGKAWCKNLASYSDFANRLPRGRTYARNGSVIDLNITSGKINALVSGSSIYKVHINMEPVSSSKWHSIVKECAGKIDSLIELLQGKFSKAVMEIITNERVGLFPHPKEMKMSCSCLDYAGMCKHVAAVLYGIGARFDEQPEKLFILRSADHMELISKAGATTLAQTTKDKEGKKLTGDLSSLFGIDIETKTNEKDTDNVNKVVISKKRKLPSKAGGSKNSNG